MNISYSFNPDPNYSGNYIAVVYGAADPAYAIAQKTITGPLGSVTSGTISNVPNRDAYILKFYTEQCGSEVGSLNITPNVYKYTRSAQFTKTDCPSGQSGSQVPFSKEYSSVVSAQDAQDVANADTTNFNTLGQAFANQTGTCSVQVVPIPLQFTQFTTFVQSGDIMGAAPSPFNNNYYSYLYKNLNTGHYVFSLYFNLVQSEGGNNFGGGCNVGFGSNNAINNGQPAPIARITDPNLFPSANIDISGTGYSGRPISGYISTNGYIYITQSQGKSICSLNPNDPNMYMMRLKNLTYAAEFSTQGIYAS